MSDETQNNEIETPRQKNDEAGFTLVEVMVTLVIIGLLTTFVVINVLPVQDKALVQKAKADIKQIELALEQYRLDMFTYPEQAAGLEALRTLPAGADEARYRPDGYIKVLEKDPWGNDYNYRFPGEYGVVDVFSYGSDGEPGGEGTAADITNWEQ